MIKDQIKASIEVKQRILEDQELLDQIQEVAERCITAYQNGGKTLLAGNGGSAADAQHISAELVNRFYFNRPGIPSIALTTDSSIMTSIGNDFGFDQLFSRQVEVQGNAGDLFIAISTSGNSVNLIEAVIKAKQKGLITVGLTGETGGKMADQCDFCLKVPSTETPRIQEAHILIGHIICYLIEKKLFGHLNR
ncbi:MAG TPA: D-sedoheptulose 7-phosphate isomerase [Sunxiuqinia sp.]|nr:D-sedoheptulose 7-phosphate isomerase [Sunxiuqinia sp.]